jgi:hypothetical protein
MSQHRLNEIVIERPRGGMRIPLKKVTGTQKFLYQLTQEAINEGLLRPYLIKPRKKTKYLSDHLNPLRGLLRSKVGQPWNQVHSELSRRLDANTMTGRHVLDHLRNYVTEKVVIIDGVPYARDRTWRRGNPLGSGYHEEFYVHPETGILCLAPKRSRLRYRVIAKDAVSPKDAIPVDRYHRYQKINDVWYLVTLADLPGHLPVWDVVEKAIVRSKELGRRYAIDKRQCSKQELKNLRRQHAAVFSS